MDTTVELHSAEADSQLLDLAAAASAHEGIRQGLDDVARGRVRPAREVFDAMRAAYGISRDRTKRSSRNI